MAKSRVVLVRSALAVTDSGDIDMDILHQMMETGLDALAGSNDHLNYLESIFDSGDVIGIKVNGLAGPAMSTRSEVVLTFSNLLKDAGRKPKNQIIWDRFDRELAALGFTVRTRGDGPLCFGTDHSGIGYSQSLVSKSSIGSLLSRILADYCDTIVNMPILKDHGIAGITCSMKNHYGSIHNPNKYHENAGDPYIADLNSLEQIKSKQRLIVADALKIQYHGGPAYHPQWATNFGGLLFGIDPVAVDSVGYGIIEDLRKNSGLKSLKGTKREPIYIKRAAEDGLGNNDPGDIEFIKLKI